MKSYIRIQLNNAQSEVQEIDLGRSSGDNSAPTRRG